MNRTNYLVFVIAFLISLPIYGQDRAAALQDLRVDVIYLASDYLEGRMTGTRGEALAAQYIASRFEELGLKGAGDEGSYFQSFPFKELTNPHAVVQKPAREGTAKNVVALLDNGAPTTVVIGAHYDHLGKGGSGSGSLHAGTDQIHNGADDNASGVAALFNIAAQLKASKASSNNYLFIAFSGEELGLFGSKYFAEHPTIDLKSINYMFNMDMVGRLNEEKVLAITGAGTSPIWKTQLEKIKSPIQIKTSDSGIGPSDHTSFYTKDIPVLHFFTGQHTDYHKPSDDSHLVNYEGIQEVADFIAALIKALDDKGRLAFTKTKETEERQAASFKVTLGVMPDYVYTGEGMRIDAVIEGRTAHKAGLKDGDIVIRIGDVEVKDIYGYMEGLSKFEVGDHADVVVKRGKKEVKKKVVF